MRRVIIMGFVLLLPSFLLAQEISLRQLIEHAENSNGQIRASQMQVFSRESQASAAQRDYMPTVDIGGSYARLNPVAGFSPEKTTSGFVLVGFEVFDSGRKRAQLEASRFAHQAALFYSDGVRLGVTLDVINRYYILQQQQATLKALEGKSTELKVQLDRLEGFMRAGLAMQDEVDRIRAAFEDSRYQIEAMRFDIETTKENLWVQTGIKPEKLRQEKLKEPLGITLVPSHEVQQILAQSQEIQQQAKVVESSQLPQVTIQNRYIVSDYKGLAPNAFGSDFLVEKQNTFTVNGSMRIFDGGKTAKEKEVLHYQHLALESQKDYLLKQQQSEFLLASKRLDMLQAQLVSTKSALMASQSSYRSVTQKFEAGIVDYVTYLDALSDTIASEVRHQQANYDLEIAKALYYYYAGRNPKEFIQ